MNRLAWSIVVCFAVVFALIRGWLLPLNDSFWIDETGTVWLIQDGWKALVERTSVRAVSIPYSILMFAWYQIAGPVEWLLRLPSVLAIAATVAVLAVFTKHRLGPGAEWPVLVFALVSPEMQFFAADARPYGLTFFLVALSAISLVRLHESFTLARAIAWAVATALTVWCQPTAAFVLPAHAIWILLNERTRSVRWLGPAFLAAALIAPEVIRMHSFSAHASELSYAPSPTLVSFLGLLFPRSIVVPAAAALVATFLAVGKPDGKFPDKRWFALAVGVAVTPALMVAAISCVTPLQFFVRRYLIAAWLGWFFLVACLLAGWRSPRARLVFTATYAILTLAASLVLQGWRIHHSDVDWRGAMAAVRRWENGRSLPLVMQTGFVEGSYLRHLSTPLLRAFLVAPALVYPHSGPTYALPYTHDPKLAPYLDQTAARLEGRPFTALFYKDSAVPTPQERFLTDRFGQPEFLGRFLRVRVYGYNRGP